MVFRKQDLSIRCVYCCWGVDVPRLSVDKARECVFVLSLPGYGARQLVSVVSPSVDIYSAASFLLLSLLLSVFFPLSKNLFFYLRVLSRVIILTLVISRGFCFSRVL